MYTRRKTPNKGEILFIVKFERVSDIMSGIIYDNEDFELELSDDIMKLIDEYAEKTERTGEEVVEYILKEFLQDQLHVFVKIAERDGKPLKKVLSRQFYKTLKSLMIAPAKV